MIFIPERHVLEPYAMFMQEDIGRRLVDHMFHVDRPLKVLGPILFQINPCRIVLARAKIAGGARRRRPTQFANYPLAAAAIESHFDKRIAVLIPPHP